MSCLKDACADLVWGLALSHPCLFAGFIPCLLRPRLLYVMLLLTLLRPASCSCKLNSFHVIASRGTTQLAAVADHLNQFPEKVIRCWLCGAEAAVAVLQRATSAATEACESALARCQRLNGGIELPSLALVADDRLAALLGDLQVYFLPTLLLTHSHTDGSIIVSLGVHIAWASSL